MTTPLRPLLSLCCLLAVTLAVGAAPPVTDHYLRSLGSAGGAVTVVIDNPVMVDTSVYLPANVTLQIGPGGSITSLPGVTFEVRGAYAAPPTLHHLFGEGWVKLPNTEVYPDWFGARPNATHDADYRLTVDAPVPNAHYFRKALFAAGPGGRIRLARQGVYEALDAADLRQQFARNFGASTFKERKGALDLNPRFEGGNVADMIFDGVTVRGQGKAATLLACPNDDSRCVGFIAAIYRQGGWSYHPDSVLTYGTEVVRGQQYLVPRTAREREQAKKMDRVMVVNGGSYYDQEKGQMNRGARVEGDRLLLDYPFEKNMGLEAFSHYGTTLEAFTAPPEGGSVRIRTEKSVGKGRSGLFSIENDLYELVSKDGDDLYTVRSVPGHGNAVGKVYPAGSRTGMARVVIPMRLTPAEQTIEDIGVVGRYDGAQISNVMDLTFRRSLIVQAPPVDQGLTINADGSLNVTFEDCTIIGAGDAKAFYGQLARSTTNMHFVRCRMHPLEVSEFTTGTRIEASELYLDGGDPDAFTDREVLSVGSTTAFTEVLRTTLRGSNLVGIVGSRDIQVYGSTAGGGLVLRDVTVEGDNIRNMFNFGVAGVDIDGLHSSGRIRGWITRLGAQPDDANGRNASPDVPAVSRMRNATFVGRVNQVIAGYWGAADATFEVRRTGYYDDAGARAGAYSRSRGSLIDKSGPREPTFLRVEGLIHGWTLREERDPEVQYPGDLTETSYVRLTLQDAALYDRKLNPTGERVDSTICFGPACRPYLPPVWHTGSLPVNSAQGSVVLRIPDAAGQPLQLFLRPESEEDQGGGAQVWYEPVSPGSYRVSWSGAGAGLPRRIEYAFATASSVK